MLCVFFFFFFFFQAEDGIRDVERSRGLGDVYKRQDSIRIPSAIGKSNNDPFFLTSAGAKLIVILPSGKLYPLFIIAVLTLSLASFTDASGSPTISVSYTHLTLPTILLVQISVVAVSLKKKKKKTKRNLQSPNA
eukprot:TRINITY_DN16563_c0_g1_i5.p3 TRINITY_DN16563_c0_g1~~TRINITY_DN16563_c0_g1_i5.p3  ORF type:complete len:135 (+),score=44.59 TRINITY_DN16563_c0_g1_i5:87-491(+)